MNPWLAFPDGGVAVDGRIRIGLAPPAARPAAQEAAPLAEVAAAP